MTFAIWIIFALSLLLLYGAIRRETGFRLLKTKEEEGSGKGITLPQLDDLFAKKSDNEKSNFRKWVEERDKIFWLVLTLLVAYVAFAILSEKYASAARAIVVGIGFHFVWYFFGKKSWVAPFVIYCMGAYFVLYWWKPSEAQIIRDSSIGISGKAVEKTAQVLKEASEGTLFIPKPRITADGWEELDGGWRKTVITTSAEVDANGNPVAITPKVNGKPLDLRGKIYKFSCIEHGTLIVGETTTGETAVVPCEEAGINFGTKLKYIGFAPKGTPTTVEFSYQTRSM